MTIKATEVGKAFRYATYFDLSANTALSLKFTDPNGDVSTITNPKVTAPASPVVDPDLGSLAADTYMEFDTEATDFTVAGTWTVCGQYDDATPKVYFGDNATFTVEEAC
jgi:hypothetical protein